MYSNFEIPAKGCSSIREKCRNAWSRSMKIVILSFAMAAFLGAALLHMSTAVPASSSPTETTQAIAADFKPGQSIRDCPNCPEMVVVPAGSFTMGSPANEQDRDDIEGPQRQVSVGQFAV